MVKRVWISTGLCLGLWLPLTACQGNGPTSQTAESPAAAPVTPEPADENQSKAQIEQSAFTALDPVDITGDSPAQVVLEAFGSKGEFPRRELLQIRYGKGEVKTEAIAIYSKVGLLDDSVNGIRYRIDLKRSPEDDTWSITWLGRQTKCQSGRGQADWGTELCT